MSYTDRSVQACDFGYMKKRDCTVHVEKTKAHLFLHMLKLGFLMTGLQ